MAGFRLLSLCLTLTLVAPGAALADPWKDESGRGRDRQERGWDQRDDRRDDRRGERWDNRRDHDRDRDDRRGAYRGDRPSYAPPRIPYGHEPPPGEYRTWFPDQPPGHQPPPYRR